MALAAEGLSNPEIGQAINRGMETVKGHVKSILAKYEARTRAAAVQVAWLRGDLPHYDPLLIDDILSRLSLMMSESEPSA